MSDADYEQLLDLISEAALAPQLWTPVMARMTDILGGRGAMLSRMSIYDGSGAAQFVRPDAAEAERLFACYGARNPMQIVANPTQYRRSWVPRVLTDDDLMPKSDLMRSEFYNDCLRPLDIHSVMFFRLAMDEDDVFAISISRAQARDRFDAEELAAARRLHPHLLRSFALGRKFSTTQRKAEDLADALNGLRHAVILVAGDGRVQYLNTEAERLASGANWLVIRGGRLSVTDPGEARRLAQLVGVAAAADCAQRNSGAMTVGTFEEARGRLSLTVSPLRSARDTVFGGEACVMVAINDPQGANGLDERILRDVFGLTPAEGRVALAMFKGGSSKEVALSLGLSFFTVRAHLVRIFEKTGTNRQADLIRVLMQASGNVSAK